MIIAGLIIAGALVWWFLSAPEEKEPENQGQPPVLFGKDDYQIIEKGGEKYIEIEKVGFSAKAPAEWIIELKGDDIPQSEYWLEVYSPTAEFQHGLLIKGCAISLSAGIEPEINKETRNNIKIFKENPEKSDEIKKGYNFEIILINNNEALKWTSPEKPLFGQSSGISLPIDEKKLIDITTTFPPGYKENCLSYWEEFLGSIVMEEK